MSETINFDDIVTTDFEALPEERYDMEAVEAIMGVSQAGNKKVTVTFSVVDGEFKNRKIWHDFSLVQKAWSNLKNYFEAAGIETDGEINMEDLPSLMQGTQVSGYVTQNEYNGKINNKVSNWAAVGAGNDQLFT